jgi:hypothetical protein
VNDHAEILRKWTAERLDHYSSLSEFEKVALARTMPGGEKMCVGALLFERECEVVKAKIRDAFPQATDQHVMTLLREYLRRRHGDD